MLPGAGVNAVAWDNALLWCGWVFLMVTRIVSGRFALLRFIFRTVGRPLLIFGVQYICVCGAALPWRLLCSGSLLLHTKLRAHLAFLHHHLLLLLDGKGWMSILKGILH